MKTKRQQVRSYEKPTKAWERKVRQKAKIKKPKKFRNCAIDLVPLRGVKKVGEVCQLAEQDRLFFEIEQPAPVENEVVSPEIEQPAPVENEVVSPEQQLGPSQHLQMEYERSFDQMEYERLFDHYGVISE
ncbi:Hypothetical predicted protein [Paramuricea clavata]|uniref:Uncharacterized protein n=1 Tax=Paramuricea clavata TaxID=317549 RepID=A0A6S7GLY8_PARCT|nr:Hypothetical predicted protein [Paramuricea clavata]